MNRCVALPILQFGTLASRTKIITRWFQLPKFMIFTHGGSSVSNERVKRFKNSLKDVFNFCFCFCLLRQSFLKESCQCTLSVRDLGCDFPQRQADIKVISGLIYVFWNLKPSNRLLYDRRKDLRALKTNGRNYQPKASIAGYAKTKQKSHFYWQQRQTY